VTALSRNRVLSWPLSALLLAQGCGGGGPNAAAKALEGGVQHRELPSVRVAPVVVREMARVLETTSKLDSENEIVIMPRVTGVVLTLNAEEGDSVGEGEVLATLDDVEQKLAVKDAEVALHEAQNALDKLELAQREAEASVSRAQLSFDQAVRDYERNLKLFQGEQVASALSQSALEASRLARDNADADRTDADLARERSRLELAAGQTAVERARITLERAQVTLGYTQVKAPFKGVIAQRSIKVGDSVGPATEAFVLTDVSLLRAVFSRPQEEFGLFSRVDSSNGDGHLALTATADAYPGHTFVGWIERMSPTVDPQSGQFRVTGRLECVQDGGRVRLLPGMLVRLRIVTDRHPEALVVPKRSLEREGDRRFLLTVKDETVARVEVREGFAEDDWIEVIPAEEGGLEAGDPVIVVGGRDLAEGDAVRVDEVRPSQEAGVPEAAATQEERATSDG